MKCKKISVKLMMNNKNSTVVTFFYCFYIFFSFSALSTNTVSSTFPDNKMMIKYCSWLTSRASHASLFLQMDGETIRSECNKKSMKHEMAISSGSRKLMRSVRKMRKLSGPGSSPPRCSAKCGRCTPCKPVHVAVPPGTPVTAEYYPEAWRCKCGNKLFMP